MCQRRAAGLHAHAHRPWSTRSPTGGLSAFPSEHLSAASAHFAMIRTGHSAHGRSARILLLALRKGRGALLEPAELGGKGKGLRSSQRRSRRVMPLTGLLAAAVTGLVISDLIGITTLRTAPATPVIVRRLARTGGRA